MPNRVEILNHARGLESHVWAMEEDPEGAAVWTGRAYGARFELSKPAGLVIDDDMEAFMLTLRGRLPGQKRLEQEFIDALGKPEQTNPARRFRYPRMLLWDAKAVLAPQPSA